MKVKDVLKKKSSKSDHSIEIDLRKMFGRRRIPGAIKEDVAIAVIEKIVDRTRDGKSLKGNSFKKLSEAYADLKGTTRADLTLDGDMLDQLDIKSIRGNKVKIGWQEDIENKKAFNHDTGDTLPKREFFGLQQSELDDIIKEFKGEIDG